MQRRLLLALAPVAVLAACGFELRKAPKFVFTSLFVGAPNSPVGNELKRYLASVGSVQVVNDPKQINTAQVILDVLQEQREKVVVGMNSAGQVTEFQLRLRFRFRLRTPQGKELIPDTEILLQRDISFSESAVLSKEAEEGLLYRDMQSDLVQQLMRRLAAVKEL
ncbi:LPS assembly lipoprotein LptE [Variovorax terrae]|uniref:LPS-assembly lipoprotein LptE n=1 Tax=Variovorax terrae TaxID=2923278 RepID=UPI003C6EE500